MNPYLDSIEAYFASGVSRPFLDLSPSLAGEALFVRRVEYEAQDMLRGQPGQINIQRLMPSSFRHQLTREIRLPQYNVQDPRELPADLASERWHYLNDQVNAFNRLSPKGQILTARLLLSLGFHSLVRSLIPEHVPIIVSSCEKTVRLALIRAHAGAFGEHSKSEYEVIALNAPCRHSTRMEAAIALISDAARGLRNAELTNRWAKYAKFWLDSDICNLDAFHRHFVTSRVYRATALAPYLRYLRAANPKDAEAMSREMDVAEHHARHLLSIMGSDQEYPADRGLSVARENFMIVLLARVKEAIALHDLDLSEQRSKEMVTYDRMDSTNFFELGNVMMLRKKNQEALEAFRQAALLGSPAVPKARYMMGQCFETLGEKQSAAACYLECLAMDPLAYSAAHRLYDLANSLGQPTMANWSRARIEAAYNVVKGKTKEPTHYLNGP